MIKINLDEKINGPKGDVYRDGDQDMTVGSALTVMISLVDLGEEKNPVMSYRLANKMAGNGEVELKSEEVVFIKKVLTKSTWVPYVRGFLLTLIEE